MLAQQARIETNDFFATLPKFSADGPAVMESAAVHEGDTVGPYRLIREIGRGGMSTVWQAVRADGSVKRVIALKLPHTGVRGSEFAERLARERDILAALTHPNIARLYDAGVSASGQPYLAMEYVEGTQLIRYCDENRLSIRERARVFLQVLSTVHFAHSQLIIHRDLKPSNILVTAQRHAALLDFGIAKLLVEGQAQETELTQHGGRVMTPNYASPEQITGQPVGTASDTYSLGVLLFELLTGELPYKPKRDSRGALEDAIVADEPQRPSQCSESESAATSRGTTPKKAAAMALIDRAKVNLDDGKLLDAATDAREALAITEAQQGGEPYSNRTGLAWLMLGRVLARQGSTVEATKALRAAVSHLSNTVDPVHPAVEQAQHLLASLGSR